MYGSYGGGGGYGGGRGGGGGFRRRSFGPREMHKIKCSQCGKEDEVPFKPREGTPVYCKDCFMKRKGITPREGPSVKEETGEETESSDEVEEAEEKEE
jgi:CxxC-x17-CxxC domain-containing protein